MLNEYYSQSGKIESYVQQFFPNLGFFLEIGAWDGKHISQTLYLEQRGWKGLCVDPFPHGFADRKCLLCNKAVSADGRPREFVWVTADRRDGGDVSYLSGFKDSLTFHWNVIQEHCNYEVVTVETITIPQLYADYHLPQFIEFLSIDTEGSELEIFSSIDLNICKFGVIAYEHNTDENVRKAIGRRLEDYGYRLLENMGWDDVYVWSDHGS